MNIAIFGGSFDPFHIGHEKIVNTVLKELNIDKLFLVPTFLNPFKNSSFLDANTRLELIKDMYKNSKSIEIIDYEVKQNKKVTSYETIKFLKTLYSINKIYLVIGADNLNDVHLWYNFENLKNEVIFVVFSRDDISLENNSIEFINYELDEKVSSSKLRKNMDINFIPKKIQNKVKELWKIE